MPRQPEITKGFTRVVQKLNALKSLIDGLGGGPSFFETIIWAEENASIAANQSEYSFGNGATGEIGLPSFWNCEAVGMVFDADAAGTSATVALRINASNTAGTITSTGETAFVDFGTPITISRGDRIGFRTTAVSGTFSDVRVGVVLRVQTITT